MNGLKICWPDTGKVEFKGKGIIAAWRDEMARQGWLMESDPHKWKECDLVFFFSDSQLFIDPLDNKPTILYFWGWEPARLLDRGMQKAAAKVLQYMARCTRILTPGFNTTYQVADFGLPSYVCLAGVDANCLDQVKDVPREPRVMFMSRFVHHKHLETVIQALGIIRPSPKLLAVGPGDREDYQELADKLGVSVEFAEIEDEDKGTELRKSAVFVHPSEYEGFGLPPLEALYVGTPVIAFDIPQLRWLLQEDAYYFTSVQGLAEAIIHVFEHPGEALEKAARGSQRVKGSLTLKHACYRLWPHIHQVIKEHLGQRVRREPDKFAQIYDEEHRRNWAYGSDKSPEWAAGPARFDPQWARHWRAQHFIEALKECQAHNILDVGCGAVYPTIFAQAGFEVHAVDISKEALDQVIKIAQKWGVENKIWCQEGPAENLPWAISQFDAVVQGELWEHVPDPRKVIDEGLRVLKPGGYLIASSPIGQSHYDPMHLRFFDDQSIAELLKPYKVKRLEKIAEGEGEPSCYFVVIEK